MRAKRRTVAALSILMGLVLAALPAALRAQEPDPGPDPEWDAPETEMAGPEMTPAAFGGPGAFEPGTRMGRHRQDLVRELDLSSEQRGKIADLREKQARNAIRIRADLGNARLDLARLMRADKPDRAAIGRTIEKLGELRTEMQKSRVNTMLDVRALLTPEQQQKLRERRRG